jgi:hypothetical protein
VLKNQPYSRVQRVVGDNGAVVTSQKHTSNDVFVSFLKAELGDEKLALHLFSSLFKHDGTKGIFAFIYN